MGFSCGGTYVPVEKRLLFFIFIIRLQRYRPIPRNPRLNLSPDIVVQAINEVGTKPTFIMLMDYISEQV